MSFPRYASYKESGVGWLGKVPEHWQMTRTKRVVPFTTGWTPPTGDSAAYDGENLWANISDLGPRLLDATAKSISDDAINRFRIKPSPGGSLLFSFKLSIGQVSFAGRDMFTNEAIATFLPSPKLDLNFAYYAFPLFLVQNASENIYGARLLNQELIRSATFPLPSICEQTRIAEVLDQMTAKIDALVEEQRRLMELLKEKRQAVISHAVTRGLNPAAPLKPSGLEWLGEVPEHWEVGPVKRFLVSLDGRRVPLSGEERSYRGGEFPYYGASGIIDSIDAFLFDEDLVLVSEDGANLLNRSTPIAFVATGKYWVNNHAHILRPCDRNRVFWAELLDSLDISPVVTGSAQPKLTVEALMNLRIAVPPSERERFEIEQCIKAERLKFDALIAEAQRAIGLLQERRAALISAAVTGQIDVRGLATVDDAIVLPCARRTSARRLSESLPGAREMLRFCETGDVADLPENPAVAVVLDWLCRLEEAVESRREFGLADDIARLGWTHQQAMDAVLDPANEGRFDGAEAAHPLVLMHCLWRIGVQYGRDYAPDLSVPIGGETFYGAGRLWSLLRAKLMAGDYCPRLVFSR